MGANFVDDESGDLLRSSVGPMQLPVSLHKLLGHRPGLYLSESAPNFYFYIGITLKENIAFEDSRNSLFLTFLS